MSLTTLIEETKFPFQDLSVDRIIIIHALEFSQQVRSMLRDTWRILKDDGRTIIVVPDGQGLPYSANQPSSILESTMFAPTQIKHAICIPPVKS